MKLANKHFYIIRIGIILAVLVTVGLLGWLYLQKNSQAADMSRFDPGNIMSDSVMMNKDSMGVQQIQAFLDSKNACNNTNTYMASWYPHLQYNIQNGRFVCMAQERFNGKSAAQIIWQVSQEYTINPQVLIVLLEKEQGLVSDTWPNYIQYRTAAGFGCPDTAPCEAQYFGLENQLRHAANLFRSVLNGGWSNYPVGNTYVQYHPNAACGGTIVNIQNRATSALYRYTPYQPNASALAAGYGTGDGCGAYGNRNFWLYFNDWFGDSTKITPSTPPEPAVSVTSADLLGMSVQTHVQDKGCMAWKKNGEIAGTTGESKRIEAIKIDQPNLGIAGNVEYRTHVQDKGWMAWKKNGEIAGTTGESKRVEAVEIRLTDQLAQSYDISYRTHVQDKGWMAWKKNGEIAGTTGESKRVEAVEIRLIKK